jgi:Calx-beta domain/Divergent InlB B-repeat domain
LAFLFAWGALVGALSTSITEAAQLTLDWVDTSGGLAAFNIERKTGTTGTYARIAQQPAQVVSYVDSTVASGTMYCYRVQAFNSAGTSDYSNEACASPAGGLEVTVETAGTGTGTVTSSPAGITCGTDCSESYPGGTVVTLTPTAASGSTFSGWSNGCTGTAPCTLTGNTPVRVTAAFTTTVAALPTVTITASSPSAAEAGAIGGSVTVSRTGSVAAALIVSYTVSGTATPGIDYLLLAGSLTFPVGASTATLTVVPIDDALVEGDETVAVTLTPTAAYDVGFPASATVTLTDNDGASPPPGGNPTLSASPTTAAPGGTVAATWSGIAGPTDSDWLALYVPGAPNSAYLAWHYTNGAASDNMPFVLPASLAPGSYELRLMANKGYTSLATSNVLTVTAGAASTLSASPTTVAAGGTVTVSWSGIAGPTSGDWLGLYVPGTANNAYLIGRYATGEASGSMPFVLPVLLAPGSYELRLLANKGYTSLATSNVITVAP